MEKNNFSNTDIYYIFFRIDDLWRGQKESSKKWPDLHLCVDVSVGHSETHEENDSFVGGNKIDSEQMHRNITRKEQLS